MEFLPDSRTRERTGGIRGPGGETLIPIYCANCGTPWGRVPEKLITFAFALCNECVEKHGAPAHLRQEPDEVFWRRAREAMLEEHGRFLSPEELVQKLEDSGSLESRLAREWENHVKKTL